MAKHTTAQQTAEGLPLVAVDMGSSSFKTMAAVELDPMDPNGSPLRILASHNSEKRKCVKKGVVQNTSEASYMLRESMLLISNKIRVPEPLPAAVAITGGRTMHCTTTKVKRSNGMKSPISRNLLDNMHEECIRKVNEYKAEQPIAALDARPGSFVIDGEEINYEPEVGTPALQIEGYYSTFYGAIDLRDKVTGSFERAGKSIEQIFARPSALVEALASEDDELRGVCIIDMGAETTTISIYKAGQFLSCRVVPQGGHNITMDIAQLGISEQNAEKLKLRFGSAFETKEVKTIRIPALREGDEPILVQTDFLSHIIVSRLDEMMQAIFAELKRYEDQIGSVYITGGASRIANILPYMQEHTNLPVSYGSHADWLATDVEEEFYAPEYSAIVGGLLLAAKYRRQHPGKALPDTKVGGNKTNNLLKKVADLFTQTNN